MAKRIHIIWFLPISLVAAALGYFWAERITGIETHGSTAIGYFWAERITGIETHGSTAIGVAGSAGCGNPGDPLNGKKTGGNYGPGGQLTFTCSKGYGLTGDSIRVCQNNGQWSGKPASCTSCHGINISTVCVPRHFADPPLPVTALFSFPGSGNTWTRHLLEQLTGVYTGAVYTNGRLKKDFPGEGKTDGSVIAIKTHQENELDSYDRIIMIIRNPLDATLAEFKRQIGGGQTAGVKKKMFYKNKLNKSINRFAKGFCNSWKMYVIQALKQYNIKPILIIHYENLKHNLRQQLILIGNFLNVTTHQHILQCVLCSSEGLYHRKNDPFDPYNSQVKQLAKKVMKDVNSTLLKTCGIRCALPF